MKRTIIYLLLLLVVISSCSKELPDNTIFSIPDEFNISIHQKPTLQGIQPSFLITTKSHFQCSNADLEVQLSSFEKELQINISDIIESSDCNFDPGVLQEEVFAFLPIGRYKLEIKLKNEIINKGSLTITDKLFSFGMETTYGFEIESFEVNKIPDNHLWGIIKSNNPEDLSLGDKLREELQPYTRISNKLSPGNYGVFQLTEDYTILFNNIPSNLLTQAFIYEINDEGAPEASAIIKKFQEEYPQLEINASTTREIIL